jgi:hypothetical protein
MKAYKLLITKLKEELEISTFSTEVSNNGFKKNQMLSATALMILTLMDLVLLNFLKKVIDTLIAVALETVVTAIADATLELRINSSMSRQLLSHQAQDRKSTIKLIKLLEMPSLKQFQELSSSPSKSQ